MWPQMVALVRAAEASGTFLQQTPECSQQPMALWDGDGFIQELAPCRAHPRVPT